MGATVFVQPLDLVKNRMQLSGNCLFTVHVLMREREREMGFLRTKMYVA